MLNELTPEELSWMQEVNREAVRRGLDPQTWPSVNIVSGVTCWVEDYRAGLTPAQALTRSDWYFTPVVRCNHCDAITEAKDNKTRPTECAACGSAWVKCDHPSAIFSNDTEMFSLRPRKPGFVCSWCGEGA